MCVRMLNFSFIQLVAAAMTGKVLANVAHLLVYKKKNRGSVTHIADRLGNPGPVVSEWLILTAKENLPTPDVVFFPKPPKAADGSLMYDRIPNKPEAEKAPPTTVAAAVTSSTTANALPAIGSNSSHSPPPLASTMMTTTTGCANSSTTSSVAATAGAGAPPVSVTSVAVVAPLPPVAPTSNNNVSNSLKRRTYDDSNGVGDSKYSSETIFATAFALLF